MTAGSALAYVQLLGNASAMVGGAQIPFIADKRFQLLAYLAYQGDWVSRERAAFLFWPDTNTQNAKQNLRGLLQRVRALTWLSGLEADAHQLRWPVRTDVSALNEMLAAAMIEDTLSLYQGPLLSGLESDGNTEFSEWLELEREMLYERWREALLRNSWEQEASEHPARAFLVLRTLLERDPLDEEALQGYMRVALIAQQYAQALGVYLILSRFHGVVVKQL